MSLNEVLERGQRVRLLSGEKGNIIGKNENFEFPLWEIKLENGNILTEARYKFDVLTEPEVSNDPGNSDSLPTVPEELMHLFQSEIYESDDSDMPIVSVLPDLPPPPPNPSQTHQSEMPVASNANGRKEPIKYVRQFVPIDEERLIISLRIRKIEVHRKNLHQIFAHLCSSCTQKMKKERYITFQPKN